MSVADVVVVLVVLKDSVVEKEDEKEDPRPRPRVVRYRRRYMAKRINQHVRTRGMPGHD